MATDVGTYYLDVIPKMGSMSGASGQASTMGAALGTRMSGSMTKSFSAGTVALGGAIAALGLAAANAVGNFMKDTVSAGMDFDSAMSQVAATMGVTTDEIEDLSKFAQKMGSTTAFSATQSAEALNYMALAGYDSEKAMAMLPNVLNMAAAGNMELARASDMVTDASSALGLSTEETTQLVDQMAQAASKSNTSVEQLGDAMLTVGGTAKVVKGGTQEISTALGILADNGIKGSEGGTALRNVILSLTAPTDKAAMAMEDLGLQVFDAEGNMRPMNEILGDMGGLLSGMTEQQRAEWISTVFNKRDLKSVEALLAGTGANVGNISQALATSGVDWQKYAGNVLATGDVLDGTAEDMASRVNAAFTAMSGEGKSYDEILSAVQARFGLTAEDAEVALSAIQDEAAKGTDRWSELSGAIGDAQGAAEKMANTQLDNLEGDVTLFNSALEGLQIALFHGVEPALRFVVQTAGDLISTLTNALNGEDEGPLGMLIGGFATLRDTVAGVWEGIQPALGELGAALGEVGAIMGELVGTVLSAFGFGFQDVDATATGMAQNITSWLVPAIQNLAAWVREHIVPAMQDFAAWVREHVVPVIQDMSVWVREHVVPAIMDFAAFVTGTVVPALGDLVLWIGEHVVPVVQKMAEFFMQHILPALQDFAGFVLDNVVPALRDIWSWVNDHVVPIIATFAEVITETIMPAVFDIAGAIVDRLVPAFESVFGFVRDNVLPIFQGLIDMLGSVLDFIGQVAADIGGVFGSIGGFFFGESPSYSYHAAGGWVSSPTPMDIVGERGGEFVWPSYGPYLDKYADALASRIGGGGVTITGNNFTVREDADIERIGRELTRQWNRQQRSASWAS